MSTEKLQETSFLSEFSDVDLNSSQLTDEDEDEERRSLTTSSHGRRQECSKTILIASMAITLLVLSMLAIAWKKTDKREFVPPSDVVVPPVEDPPYHRVFIGRLGGAKSPRNWSTLPRNKQFMVPGMRAFAGEPTTEFSMIEIADVNFDSLRTQKTASPVTYEIGDPEVNEPFRQEAVTTHWRAALRRKDVGLTSKSLPVWNNVNDSLPVTPNLVRRFIGRRGFSTVATTTAVTTSIGSIKAIGNDNISVYVIRVGGNINGSANASRSGNSTPNAVSEIDITATSSKVTFGTVNKRFSSEGVAEPFIKWNQLPETSDNEPPSLGVTSSGAFASTSVTERVSKSVHDVNLFSEDKSVVSLTAAPTVRDTSLFGEPSIGSHEYETKGHVTTHSPVVDRRRQDINDKEIGRIVPAFDFDESQKNVSSEQSDKPKLDAHSVPPEERISRSTVIIVSYANEREGLYGSKEQNATSPSLTGFAGQKTTVVGVDVKTHRVDKEKPESLFNGINSPKHLADGTTMSEPSELLRSVSTLAAEIMFVPLNGSNITTIISDKPIDVSQNNVLSLSSSLPEKWTAANGSMLTVVSSSPTDVVSNGDRNLPTLWTFEQETEANKSARENEAVAMSSQNRSIDNGTAAIVSQPNAVTQQNESETPPMSLRDGQIQDNITLDIGHKPSESEAASKELSLNELLNSTQATSTRYNHETILPTGSNNSLSGDIAEHSENRVEKTSSGNGSADIKHNLNDLRMLPFYFPSQQKNETESPVSNALNKDMITQTTVASVATLVSEDVPGAVVRCPTADCMEEAMALQAALDDVRLTDWPYDEEPLDLDVPEAIAFATRKMDVNPFFVPSLEIDTTTTSGWVFVIREPRAVITEDAYFAVDVVSTYQKLVMQAMSLVNSDKNIQALAEPVLYVDQEVHKFDVGSYLSTLMDGIAVLDNEVEFVIPTTSFLEDVQNVTMTFENVAAEPGFDPTTCGSAAEYLSHSTTTAGLTKKRRRLEADSLVEGFRVVLALSPLLPHNDGRDLAHLHFAREIPTRTPAKRWRFCLRLLEGIYKLPLLQLQVESFEKKDNFHTLRDLKFHSFSSPLIGNAEVRERHYHGVPDVDPSNVLTDYVLTLNIVLKNYWSYYGSIGPQFKPLYFPRSGRRIMEGLYGMLEREASFFGQHNEVVKASSWDYTTTDGYLSLRSCLKEQFRKAAMPHLVPGQTSGLHPSRPLRQDMKDNAIINVVIESQCEVTSQEAALADEIIRASHPRRYRVNHALQNNAIFSQAFMCDNTTEMNPKKKCKVW
ncbi:hypothetical protein HPB51_012188 [Rhipicephalus microplus]|uniref:Peptidase M13 C-terminal domain-containing protein n=1 Tax=Rhipicephalus microplus TaxID=6941 RepID=A0A9J6DAC6_RHIMP|nr:hypothetical protein HPB51_012188 [Rhipicephalus microplus]